METAQSGATERAGRVNELPDGTGPELSSLGPTVEAILMSVERPVTAGAIGAALAPPPKAASARQRRAAEPGAGDGDVAADAEAPEPPDQEGRADPAMVAGVEAAIRSLNESYEKTGRSFRIEHVAGGYRLMTLPQFARAVGAFHRSRQPSRLSKAAIETLAIIAYKQPITRADLESIRGVACGEVLRSLMDRRLITIKGRAEELGRPLLYGTTRQFLDAFGLATLADLPQMSELRLAEVKTAPPAGTGPEVRATELTHVTESKE